MKKSEYQLLYEVEDTHWWYVGHRRLFAGLLDRYCSTAARGRVLDAGCGTGGFTQWLWERYHSQHIVCMDLSEEALLRCGARGLEELLCCSVEYIPIPDVSFELVLSLNVLYHREVADDLKALREMHRVLVPGGYLLLNLPALTLLRGRHDEAVEGARRYRASEVRRLLEQAAYETVKITYFVSTLLPVITAYRLWSRRDTAEEGASDLWIPPAPANRAMQGLLALESHVAVNYGLPIGSSITALARKP